MKDPKEVWQESYDEDIGNGVLPAYAEVNADEALTEYSASLIDDAMNRLKEKDDV